jgi:hypothetical protein
MGHRSVREIGTFRCRVMMYSLPYLLTKVGLKNDKPNYPFLSPEHSSGYYLPKKNNRLRGNKILSSLYILSYFGPPDPNPLARLRSWGIQIKEEY